MLSFYQAPFSKNLHQADLVVVVLQKKTKLTQLEQKINQFCGNAIGTNLESKYFQKHPLELYLPIKTNHLENLNHLFLWQLPEKIKARALIEKLGNLAEKIKTVDCANIYIHVEGLEIEGLSDDQFYEQFALNIAKSHYLFNKHKSKKEKNNLKNIIFFNPNSAKKQALVQINALVEGINLCKDLANEPSNICTPSYLATQATKLAKEHQLDYQILDQNQLEKLKMGSLLAVAKGSDQAAKLIFIHYQGADKKQKPIALVGKGVCFDTGGISLKPANAMDEMKYDMCGAASVMGVMQAICKAKLKVNVIGVMACVENMPSGKATKPGDIVKSYSGKTIEILNTDAEGRLILVDALSYTIEKYAPSKIVDIATLTGAVIIALGKLYSAVLGNDQKLIGELIQAGQSSFDLTWNLPLDDEYLKLLDSNFADIANIGNRDAGTITAAQFIAEFSQKANWAHLDIAGIAWHSGKAKGATGRPVALLYHWLKHNQS